MASLPAEILLGIYLGLLVGTVPALVAWSLGFGVRHLTGATLPGAVVALLGISIAGVNGWLLALAEETIAQNPNPGRVLTATVVVGLLSMYAHSAGNRLAVDSPQQLSLSALRGRTISRDLAELVDGGDGVRVRVVGGVADMEGYPPLPPELRAEIRNAELTVPADLQLDELRSRVEDRLRTEYDLGDVSVSIDEGGRATVVAAPPFSGLSKRVADGRHAVSVSGVLPTGLARGDEVTLITPDAQVPGTVVSARTDGSPDDDATLAGVSIDNADEEDVPTPVRAPTTDGGEGRLTVAVTRTDVQPLLRAGDVTVVVESRGTRREYEVLSVLRRADRTFRRFAVRAGSPLVGARLGDPPLHEETDVSVLAVRKPAGWEVTPRGGTTLDAGDELFAAGTREELDDLETTLSPA